MTTGPDEPAPVLFLEPVDGLTQAVFELPPDGDVTVGRGSESDFRIPIRLVSRRHAVLHCSDEGWLLTDKDSTHGTAVRSRRLAPGAAVLIRAGDLVRFGPCVFRLVSRSRAGALASVADARTADSTVLKEFSFHDFGAVMAERLGLLIEAATTLDQAGTEAELADRAVRLAVLGSGFTRGALLRESRREGGMVVLACVQQGGSSTRPFDLSRSLFRHAWEGRCATIEAEGEPQVTHSMIGLEIHSAAAMPVLLDQEVKAVLYLDSRGPEPEGHEDYLPFCSAICHLIGSKLADLRRHELELEEERYRAELDAARKVQECLGPPAAGRVGNLVYSSATLPGRFVAGDYFDLFGTPGGRVAMCFGDVCGQGVPAAILTAAILGQFRSSLSRDRDLVTTVRELNDFFVERSDERIFVTLFAAVWDAREGILRYVDAGHGLWATVPHDGGPPWEPEKTSLVLGIRRGWAYESSERRLDPGDRLVVYSDGVVEHRAPQGELFGGTRLIDLVRGSASPREDVSTVLTALREYSDSTEFEDDTSLVSLQVV